MKAMVARELGSPNVLEMREVEQPSVGEWDLLIEVHACAVNPVDCKIRQTGFSGMLTPPLILGFDVSGVVRELGSAVDRDCFKVGDEVFASPNLARPGANAQWVAVDSRTAAHKPGNIDHAQAAAFPLVTITAWDGIHRRGRAHGHETVFIQGGAGGVGHIAVQLAKLRGCRVITTAGRDESMALCRELGADVVVNYQGEDVPARVMQETDGRGCELVFDTIGGEAFLQAMRSVAVHGRLVSILAPPRDAPIHELFLRDVTLALEFMGAPTVFDTALKSHHRQLLQTVAELIEVGKLRAHIGGRYALADLAEAHRQQETGHTMGKLVVDVAGV